MKVYDIPGQIRRAVSPFFRIQARISDAPLLFMHIPKTSGTALNSAFREALATSRALVLGYDPVVFGGFQAFDSMDIELRSRVYLKPADVPPSLEFLSGHISFSTLLKTYPDAQYVSFLREPFSRILSFWLHWRASADDELKPWGKWSEYVHKSRRSLIDFLSDQEIACQTDNLYVRMLLWPNKLLPDNDFIEERNDKVLINLASARLKQFSYVDVIENPGFKETLQAWLGRPFAYSLENETRYIPRPLCSALHAELTAPTLALLKTLTRLDLKLWMTLARQRVSCVRPETLREFVLIRNIARYSLILQGG